jgi:hypothetical protein
MAVVDRITLGVAYAMGVVAGRAGCLLVNHVFSVPLETIIVQNAAPAMAFIAEPIAIRALIGKIRSFIVPFKEVPVIGAMGAFCPAGVIGIVTVCTGDPALRRPWWQEANHIRVCACCRHRMKRWTPRPKLHTDVDLGYLSSNGQSRSYTIVGMTLKTNFIKFLRLRLLLSTNIYSLHTFVSPANPSGTW